MCKRTCTLLAASSILILTVVLGSCNGDDSQEVTRGEGPVTLTGNAEGLVEGDLSSLLVRPDTVVAGPGVTLQWRNQTGVGVTLLFQPPNADSVPVGVATLTIESGETGSVVVDQGADTGVYKYGVRIETGGPEPPVLDPYIDLPPPPGGGE